MHCELCGRQFKNTQGLRGHKTFFHGHGTKHDESVKTCESGFNKSDKKLERLTKDIENIIETLADFKGNLDYLQSRIVSLPSSNDIRFITSEIDRLNKEVKKHDHWFNPRGIHEAIIDLDGGPFAFIEKRLRDHQSFTK